MSTLTTDQVITLLTDYTRQTAVPVDVLLVEALALQAYGYQHRLTRDVDAEVVGSFEALAEFFSQHHIPADLTSNFSGCSVVAMPPGYRERATDLVHHPHLRVRLLAPLDFIIAKLRRGTDLDLDDAGFVAKRFGITGEQVRGGGEAALLPLPKTRRCFFFERRLSSSARAFPPRNLRPAITCRRHWSIVIRIT